MSNEGECIPYGRHWIEDDDIAAVAKVLRSQHLTTGQAVVDFEDAFAAASGAKHAITCSNGTAALHLAMLAAGIGPGDYVVVPTISFLSSANAVRFVGAEVIFADVDPDSGLMNKEHVADAMTRVADKGAIRGVVPVHLGGQVAHELPTIRRMAADSGWTVIEDACHALGTVYQSEPLTATVGSCKDAHMAAFSFHPVKTIAAGEGGMITTNDPELAAKLKLYRGHGMTRDPGAFSQDRRAFAADGQANPWYYEMQEIGFNYRLSDINCALGNSQLRKLERFVDRRRYLTARYDELLAPLAEIIRPVARTPGCLPGWHLYQILVDFSALGMERSHLMSILKHRGVSTQVHYLPIHQQPYYRNRYGDLLLEGAATFYERTLTLPLYPMMADSDVDLVVAALTKTIGR